MAENVEGIKKKKHINKRRNLYTHLERKSPESMIEHSLRAEQNVIPEEITLIPHDFNEISLKLKENGERNEKVICIFNNLWVAFLFN